MMPGSSTYLFALHVQICLARNSSEQIPYSKTASPFMWQILIISWIN